MALRPGPGAGGAGGTGGGAAGAARSVVTGDRGCGDGGDKWQGDDGELKGRGEGQSWREMGSDDRAGARGAGGM